ncbi:MAG TPA: hypothetical protein ENK60_02230 [Anaerolineae bacterium]|nr:hypothetical protein [Anaerolineae bacterium]
MMVPPTKSNRQLPLLLVGVAVVVLAIMLAATLTPSTSAVGAPQAAPDSLVPQGPAGVSVIGDFVWSDDNRDGVQDVGEPGIDGVLVKLWLDDGDGVFDPTQDTLIDQMTTGDDPNTPGVEQGWYLFDNLDGANDYWVEIDASNFDPGGPLENYELTSDATYGPNPMFVVLPTEPSEFYDADFGYAPQVATLSVTKTANPTSLPEPGGTVTFTVSIENLSPSVSVTIDTLTDSIYGDLNGQGDCSVPQTIPAGSTYTCQFTASVTGNAGDSETNVVTASGVDANSNPVDGQDDATVTITDAPSSMQVLKSADPASIPEPGGTVTFTVQVNNTSAADTLTLNSLTDSVYGDLNGMGDCAVPQTIAPGASYTCQFSVHITGNAGDTHTNTVTAEATDDDSNQLSSSDDATVTITNASSSIVVTKSASPTSVAAPGDDVTFTVVVENTSTADTVTITSLIDDVYGDLNGQGSCVTPFSLTPGQTYTCSFTYFVGGDVGDSHTNVVTASGEDDDGNPVSDDDPATVDIVGVVSRLRITKIGEPRFILEPGGPVTFTIRIENTSGSYAIPIHTLEDTIYGDLNGQGTCSIPQTIPPGGTYECQFPGSVTGVAGDSETNTVTVIGEDPDGYDMSDADSETINIISPTSSIALTKTADPAELVEPGGLVHFTIVITNTSNSGYPVTINTLTDTVYGDLDGQGTCSLPQTINAGASYSCVFIANVTGPPGFHETNIATATGEDSQGNPVQSSDSADVTIIDSPASLELVKTANPTSVPEPGGPVTFTLTITNTSAVDTVTLETLTDSIYGNLDGKGNCALPQVLAAGASYTCSFTEVVSGNAGDSETDIAIVTGTDDDGIGVHDSDDATVNITDVPASIALTKLADPTNLPEPGGPVNFTVIITNTSPADEVTIETLVDSIHGDLDGQGTCSVPQTLAVGASYTCTFTADVTGNAGYVETNVVTATGTDDDGSGVSANDEADVFITDALPSITLTKTATPSTVSEPGGVVSFTITISNTSPGDAVNILTLADSVFGDLNGRGDCSVPQTIPIGGSYTCTFTEIIRGNEGDTHTNVAIASGFDDENNPVVDSDEEVVTVGPPSSVPGCISGYKVDDLHVGLPGWVIHTRPVGSTTPEYTTTTDGSGYFEFPNLTPGEWEVWEEMQPGWEPVTSDRFVVTVFSGDNCVQVRFKNRQAPTTPTPTPTPIQPTATSTPTPPCPCPTATPTPTPTPTPPCPCLTPTPTPPPAETSTPPPTTPTPPPPPGCEDARLEFNVWGRDYSIPLWDDDQVWSVNGLPWQRPTVFTIRGYNGSVTWRQYQPYWRKQVGGYSFTYPGGNAGELFQLYVYTSCGTLQLLGAIDDPTPTPPAPGPMGYRVWVPVIFNVGVIAANPPATASPSPSTPTPTATPARPANAHVSGLQTPNDVAYNPVTRRLYITNRDNDSLTVIDARNLRRLANVDVCSQPFGVDVNTQTNRVYVACAGSRQVAVIDGASSTLLRTIDTGYFPTYVAVNEQTNRIYVVTHDSNRLEEISGYTHTVTRKIDVETGAFGLAVDEVRNRVYVGSRDRNRIAVIDVAGWRLLRDYQAHDGEDRGSPYALAFNPNTQRLYVTYRGPTFFTRLGVFRATDDGLKREATLDLPNGGEDATGKLGINPETNHVLIPNTASNSVTIVDGSTNRILKTVAVGQGPFGIAVNSDQGLAYVGAKQANQLWLVPDR